VAIVVSDTSAIRALHHLAQLPLIQRLYGELIIPPAVDEELRRPRTRFSSIDLVALGESRIESPTAEQLAKVSPMQLDRGETEAIALAMSLNSSYLLIDEKLGRLAARALASGLPA
jgi:predicted nucleic acid-binding protein